MDVDARPARRAGWAVPVMVRRAGGVWSPEREITGDQRSSLIGSGATKIR